MERRVENVYDYLSYRLILSDDFSRRVALNNNFSLRAYAQNLGVSAGFISKILNGKSSLSQSKGRQIFSKLDFSANELNFICDLIEVNNTTDDHIRNQMWDELSKNHPRTKIKFEVSENVTVKSIQHFFTYAILRDISDYDVLKSILLKIGLNSKQVDLALEDFILNGFAVKKGSEYFVTEKDFTYLQDHENFVSFGLKLARHLISNYEKKDIDDREKNSLSTLVLGLDDETLKLVDELSRNYIHSLFRLSERVVKPTIYKFLIHMQTIEDVDYLD